MPGWLISYSTGALIFSQVQWIFTLRHIFQIIIAICVSSCLIRLAVISRFFWEFFCTICFVFRPSCRSFWWLVQISWNEVGNNSRSFGIKIVTENVHQYHYEIYHQWPNARFAFTTELRDTGHYGFELPANQIIPSGEVRQCHSKPYQKLMFQYI